MAYGRRVGTAALTVAALTVAGCGGGGSGGTNASTATAAAPAAGSYGLDWARDTCKTFPAAAAAKASGMAIVKAELGNSAEANGTANSSCGYSDASGDNHFRVLLRIATEGTESVANQIAQLKDHADDMGPAQEVAVSTGQARWLPKMHEVIYYPDDMRTVIVVAPGYRMFGKSDPEDKQKSGALAIALAAAG